jgi:hypothetical protein
VHALSVAEHSPETSVFSSAEMRTAINLIQRDAMGPLSVPERIQAPQSDEQAAVGPLAAPGPGHALNQLELLTAIAKEAISQLITALQGAILDAQNASALSQWRAMGHAFLRWAHDHPAHFQVMSTPSLIDVEASGLSEGYRHIRSELRRLIADAATAGDIYCISVEDTLVSARSFIYGLARMHVDGHYPGWGVGEREALATMQRLFDSYLFRLRRTV